MTETFSDEEINRLEDIRRLGPPGDRLDEAVYYKLPPRRQDMMRDWTKWRTQINDLMSDVINVDDDGHIANSKRQLLTSPRNKKTPQFFKGNMSIHGIRAKDEYGATVVQETDDVQTKEAKTRIDENFFLFGIPRISLKRVSLNKQTDDVLSGVPAGVDRSRVRNMSAENTRQRSASGRRMSVPILPSGHGAGIQLLEQRHVRNTRPERLVEFDGGRLNGRVDTRRPLPDVPRDPEKPAPKRYLYRRNTFSLSRTSV